MQVIKIKEPIDYQKIPSSNVALAMGFFDGVHKGHQDVINEAKKQAQQNHLKLAVMTFDRYPKIYYKHLDESKIRYLTTVSERLALFEKMGVQIAYVAQFDKKLASLTPQDFVNKYMIGLHVRVVVAGFDYTYGDPKVANVQLLPQYAHEKFKTVIVSCHAYHEEKIGTTQLKKMLDEGQIEKVNHLLGHPFTFEGEVVHGKARGRKLGFPTLNIKAAPEQRLPMTGIYAVRIKYDGQWYQGMASVSHNETFGENLPLTVEINLFNFNKMIYGAKIEIEWEKYLRSPVKFESPAQLIAQLKADKKCVQKYFACQAF